MTYDDIWWCIMKITLWIMLRINLISNIFLILIVLNFSFKNYNENENKNKNLLIWGQ